MSYSRRTLAAFSTAISRVYASGAVSVSPAMPPPATAPARRRAAESNEDLAYLTELLGSHQRAAAQPLPSRAIGAAPNSAPAVPNLSRLRALGLTPRECEIIFWITQGKQDAEIAAIAGCARRTVSKHVEHLLEKLGAETRLAAAHTAQVWLKQNA